VLRRCVAGMHMALNMPVSAYRGVAIRMVGEANAPPSEIAVVLEHADPALSLPLYASPERDDIVAEWQTWGRVLGLPLLVAESDGQLREPFARLGQLRIEAPAFRRRRRTAIARRRPSRLLRRRAGKLAETPTVHRGEREAERVRQVLGERALRIEHAGSTSVPELAAKAIIDMVLVVVDSSDEAGYVPDMERAGYVLRIREPDWFQHRLFKGPDTDINLHLFSEGCAEIERMLLFRDWLRANPADRDLYVRTKRELAEQDWKYMQQYADAKTAVVTEIIARAQRAEQRIHAD